MASNRHTQACDDITTLTSFWETLQQRLGGNEAGQAVALSPVVWTQHNTLWAATVSEIQHKGSCCVCLQCNMTKWHYFNKESYKSAVKKSWKWPMHCIRDTLLITQKHSINCLTIKPGVNSKQWGCYQWDKIRNSNSGLWTEACEGNLYGGPRHSHWKPVNQRGNDRM